MKKLIFFDLDGTMAESKSAIDVEMATLLSALLEEIKEVLDPSLPSFSVRLGGATSIDVTLPGIDKVTKHLREILDIAIQRNELPWRRFICCLLAVMIIRSGDPAPFAFKLEIRVSPMGN